MQQESKTTKDAEALAALCNVGKFDTLTISKIKAVLTAYYERGKADVVPSWDAWELARKFNNGQIIYEDDRAKAINALATAARAEGEQIGFQSGIKRAADEIDNYESDCGTYFAKKIRIAFDPNSIDQVKS